MSLITDDPEQQSPRDCSSRRRSRTSAAAGGKHGRRRAAIAVSSSAVALGLILWLTLRPPSSPRFSLLAATATVATGNNASGTIIVVDAALTAHNPNARATALYDQLRASGSYAGVRLAAGAALQPMADDEGGDAVFSAALTSSSSSSSSAPAGLLLRVRVEGQLRWKMAAWVSGRRGLTVDCVAAVVPSSFSSAGRQEGSSSSPSPSQCATHVL